MKNILMVTAILLSSTQSFGLLVCHGTEPFWSVRFKTEKLGIYSSPMVKSERVIVSKREGFAGTSESFGQVITAKSRTLGSAKIVITVNAACSDGMSEEEFTHQVTILSASGNLYGCCREQK